MLVEALSGLREEDRMVIAYRYLVGLSEEETASALGVARGTVKSRLSRAMARLRAGLPASPASAPEAGASEGANRD